MTTLDRILSLITRLAVIAVCAVAIYVAVRGHG